MGKKERRRDRKLISLRQYHGGPSIPAQGVSSATFIGCAEACKKGGVRVGRMSYEKWMKVYEGK